MQSPPVTTKKTKRDTRHWQFYVVPCRKCNASIGQPCVTASGARATGVCDVHMVRMDDYWQSVGKANKPTAARPNPLRT